MRQIRLKSYPRLLMANYRALSAAVALALAAALTFGDLLPAAANTGSKSRVITSDQKIIHVLNRLGYGPRPGDVERVKQMGLDKYIDSQLHPERIDDAALQARLRDLESLRMSVAQVYEKYPAPAQIARQLGLRMNAQANGQAGAGAPEAEDAGAKADQREYRQKIMAYYAEKGLKPPQRLLLELQAQKIIRAVYSERQLSEVMVDFWFNHFNVFWGKGADRWLTTDYEMNAIRPNTLGKFKDLLMATAKSPAMLFYLDNFQSMSPDAELPGRRGRGQARRLQRRAAADDEQMDKGQVSSQQRPAQAANQLRNRRRGINENYAREILELHTLGVDGGYTQKDVQEVARAFTGWSINQPRRDGSFVFREWMHDDGEKVVLGQRIPAGGGIKDAERVIEILSRHPSTARFLSTKLARRFVSDTPPKALVDRVAAVYMKTDGDIREMLRTIFSSQEFYATEAYRAKIKSPFELAVSAIRALGAETNGAPQVGQFIAKMGQPLYQYQAPTGYPDRADQWVNTGALLERLNFGLALSSNRLRGTAVNLKRLVSGAETRDAGPALERAIALLLNGELSSETRSILGKQLKEGVPVSGELENGRPAMSQESDPASDEMTSEGAVGRGERKGQRGLARGRNLSGFEMPAAGPVDAELSKVFGLVLGSPEFQRK